MKGAMQGRTLWLGGALLAVLFSAQWVSGEDGHSDTAQPASGETRPIAVQGGASVDRADSGSSASEERTLQAGVFTKDESGQLELERLERRKFGVQAGDIFTRKSWIPPPPAMKPQPPSPPPLSFKYLGKVTEGDETRVFLSLSERNYVVKAGENINDRYRVEEVSDHAIILTYLPLNIRQTLVTTSGTAGNFQ